MAGGAALQPFQPRRAVRADPHVGFSALEQVSIAVVAGSVEVEAAATMVLWQILLGVHRGVGGSLLSRGRGRC
jgi:hypothetical protein